MTIRILLLPSSILLYAHVLILHIFPDQGKGVMNTYWLLGKEGNFLSQCEEDFLPIEKTPDFMQIIIQD
jgi:hypothetical protein